MAANESNNWTIGGGQQHSTHLAVGLHCVTCSAPNAECTVGVRTAVVVALQSGADEWGGKHCG
jgi:hypothetical protein